MRPLPTISALALGTCAWLAPQRALADPQCDPAPLIARAEAAARAGQIDAAADGYRRVIECQPIEAAHHTQLVRLLTGAGRQREVGDAWWRRLRYTRAEAAANAALEAGAAYLKAGEYGLAVDALRHEASLRSPDAGRLGQLGTAAFLACECQLAMRALTRARSMGYARADLAHDLAMCAATLGHGGQAVDELEKSQQAGHRYTRRELDAALGPERLERVASEPRFSEWVRGLPAGDTPRQVRAPACDRELERLPSPEAEAETGATAGGETGATSGAETGGTGLAKETGAPIETPYAPAPATKERFEPGADVRFTKSKRKVPLTTLLTRQDEADAYFSPDGSRMLAIGNHGATLRTPSAPRGINVKVHGAGISARFSPDGEHAVAITGGGPPTILATRDGRVVRTLDEGQVVAAAAFLDDRTLLFHTGADSRQLDGALYSIDIGQPGAKQRRIGPVLRTSRVTASDDARRWVVFDERRGGAVVVIDGRTGKLTPLVSAATGARLSFPTVSPDGERVCYLAGSDLECVRVADGGVEWLSANVHDREGSFQFDDTGKYVLFVRSETKDEVEYTAVYCRADLSARTVQRLEGVRLRSGGSVSILAGGSGVATGGARGVEVFDLGARKLTEIAGRDLYSVQGVPGRPLAVVIGHEKGSGSNQDLLLAELGRP